MDKDEHEVADARDERDDDQPDGDQRDPDTEQGSDARPGGDSTPQSPPRA